MNGRDLLMACRRSLLPIPWLQGHDSLPSNHLSFLPADIPCTAAEALKSDQEAHLVFLCSLEVNRRKNNLKVPSLEDISNGKKIYS